MDGLDDPFGHSTKRRYPITGNPIDFGSLRYPRGIDRAVMSPLRMPEIDLASNRRTML
ncbi:MAG: hypothetical protein OXD36_09685 [Rhodobacter sp.]|nr:hypothetical protein [Rhodobacter sp.]MCY4241996.1 hypothetical protein [Rhodobacter sp.]